jgi:hypothetical protein
VQTPTKGPQDQAPPAPPVERPPRREQDLIVIPEATEPRRWSAVIVVAAGVLALIVIVALAAYAIDQRDRANALDTQLTQALDDQRALIDASTVARERIVALETRLGTLEGDLQRARQGREVLVASMQETRRNLRQARRALEDEQARFRTYMGPPVGDGAHTGRLVAVGADQSPARVTVDLGRWFSGGAATEAAIDDGVIVSGDTVPRYFRNDDLTWRTLPLDTFATVTVRRWNGSGTYTISLSELQRLSRVDGRRADRIMGDPFRLSVSDGRVTALTQLRYP